MASGSAGSFGWVLQMFLGQGGYPVFDGSPAVYHPRLQETAPAPALAPAQTGNRKQEAGATVRKRSISMTIARRVERRSERKRDWEMSGYCMTSASKPLSLIFESISRTIRPRPPRLRCHLLKIFDYPCRDIWPFIAFMNVISDITVTHWLENYENEIYTHTHAHARARRDTQTQRHTQSWQC